MQSREGDRVLVITVVRQRNFQRVEAPLSAPESGIVIDLPSGSLSISAALPTPVSHQPVPSQIEDQLAAG